MDLYEAMRCAPTSRRFTAEPVAARRCERALDAARFAPSGGNRQGWRVVVVTDAEHAPRAARSLPAALARVHGADRRRADARAARTPSTQRARGWSSAPTSTPSISTRCRCTSSSACASPTSPSPTQALPRQSIVGGASIYPFVQNLLLALRDEGLGAAMTTLLVPAEAEVKRAARDPRGRRAGRAHRRRPPRRPLAEAALAQAGRGVRLRRALRRAARR